MSEKGLLVQAKDFIIQGGESARWSLVGANAGPLTHGGMTVGGKGLPWTYSTALLGVLGTGEGSGSLVWACEK